RRAVAEKDTPAARMSAFLHALETPVCDKRMIRGPGEERPVKEGAWWRNFHRCCGQCWSLLSNPRWQITSHTSNTRHHQKAGSGALYSPWRSTRPPSIPAKGLRIQQRAHFSDASQAQAMPFLSSKLRHTSQEIQAASRSQWLWLL